MGISPVDLLEEFEKKKTLINMPRNTNQSSNVAVKFFSKFGDYSQEKRDRVL
jgi:hypothetical protein